MNKKLKSLLALALSAMMLLSACGEKDKKDDDDKKSPDKGNSNKIEEVLDVEVEFGAVNSALSYVENAVSQIEDAMNGKVDTGVTTEVSVSLADELATGLGFDIKDIKLSNSAKVKGGIVANDMTLFYGGNSLISLNTVFDDNTAYFRVPEISDAYLRANADEFDVESLLGGNSILNSQVVSPVYMMANPSAGMTGSTAQIADAIDKIGEEKLAEILDELIEIAEKNMPEGKNGDKISGKINDVSYEYTSKIYTIDGKTTYDVMMDVLNYLKDSKEIAEIYDSMMESTKQEMIDSGYYTEDEINEIYPGFSKMIESVITSMESEKEDAYSTEEIAKFTVYYDGEDGVGLYLDLDSEVVEFVIVDEADKLGFKMFTDDMTWNTSSEIAFTMVGSDGKYNAKLAITEDDSDDEFDSYTEAGFSTDVEVVDEKTGAFKGTIEFYVKDDSDEVAKVVVNSNSTDKKTDMTFEVVFDGNTLCTVGLTVVSTNASDVTVPSGKTYDISNSDDIEEYAATADLEGLESHFKTVLGDDLFTLMFESDYDDDYDYDYDDDDDYWY